MNDTYDSSNNFIDEEEFVDCFDRGCELVFNYGGKSYSAGFGVERRFGICECYDEDNEVGYDTAEAMLDYPIGDKRLRDILQDMIVTDRTVFPMED
jgi:hypothetical protein